MDDALDFSGFTAIDEKPELDFSGFSSMDASDLDFSGFTEVADTSRFDDPLYRVEDADFDDWKEWSKDRADVSVEEGIGILKDSFVDVAKSIYEGAGEAKRELALGNLETIQNSIFEGLAQGTAELGVLSNKVSQAAKTKGLPRQFALQASMSMSDDDVDKLQAQVSDFEDRLKFQVFKKGKELDRLLYRAKEGEEGLLSNLLTSGEEVYGLEDFNDKIAKAVGDVADASSVLGPASMGAKAVTSRLARGGAKVAGAGASTVRGVSDVAENISDAVRTSDLGELVMDSAAPAVAAGMAQASGVGPVGVLASAALGKPASKALVNTAKSGSEVLAEGSNTLANILREGPSQQGVIERLAKNRSLPEKGRRFVGMFRPLDPAIKVASDAAEGAAVGAGVGAGLGALSDGERGAFAGAGSGGFLGGASSGVTSMALRSAGALHSKLDTVGKAELEADIAREGQRQAADNLTPEQWNALSFDDRGTVATARHILGEGFDINVLSGEAFKQLGFSEGVGGAYLPNRKTILVDASDPNFKQNFLHEFGHALYDSPAINKGDIELELETLYGKRGLNNLRRDYAAKFVEARKGKATKADIDAQMQALYQDDPNWITREVFAESVMDTLIDRNLNQLRKKGPMASLKRAILKAKQEVLEKSGFELTATGRSAIFGDKLKMDKRLRNRIESYTRDLDSFYRDTRAGRKARAKVNVYEQTDHPASGFVRKEDGTAESHFAKINEKGRIVPKTSKEIKAEMLQRQKELREFYNSMPALDVDNKLLGLKPHLNKPGKEVRGEIIPDSIKNLERMKLSRPFIEAAERAIQSGEILTSWNHKIDSDKLQSIKRRRGNVEVELFEYLPYEFFMAKRGNLSLRMIDMDHVKAKADMWRERGKLSMWGNDTGAFLNDMKAYVTAHSKGDRAETVMSPKKRDAITAFFNLANPATKDLRRAWADGGEPNIFKTLRVERFQNAEPTGQSFPFKQELANANFSAPRSQMDADYMQAVQSGDEVAVRSMVDKAAKEAGYDSGMPVYHGTTHEFTVFDDSRANLENNFGSGHYFSSEQYDASDNYLSTGADLTARIEQLAERVEEDFGSYDEALEFAKKQMQGGKERVIEAYLQPGNVAELGGDNPTRIDPMPMYDLDEMASQRPEIEKEVIEDGFVERTADFELEVDQRLQEWAEENGYYNENPHPLIEAVEEVSRELDDVQGTDALMDIIYEEPYLHEVEDVLRESVFPYAVDPESGGIVTGEAVRRVFEKMGFDSIKDHRVSEKFKNMGLYDGVYHHIVFNPNRIKSADPITYDDSGNVIPLSKRFKASSDDIRFSAPRPLNNRGGFIAKTPSGHKAVRTSSRAGIRVYDPKGRRVGLMYDSLEAAEAALTDDED